MLYACVICLQIYVHVVLNTVKSHVQYSHWRLSIVKCISGGYTQGGTIHCGWNIDIASCSKSAIVAGKIGTNITNVRKFQDIMTH